MSDINDTVKKFWDTRPCNIRHSDKEVGTKEYFDEVTKRKYLVESHIKPFVDFDAYRGKDVLEVGCGIGTAAQSFIEYGARYTGIDVSPVSIELAKKRLDVYSLEGDVFEGDIQTLVIPNKTFDLVYSFGVLHHVDDLESALKNIHTMLKPGGVFKLMMYASNSWKNMCIKHGLDQFEAQSGVPIANTYTKDEMRNNLKDFMNIYIDQDHIFQWNIDEYKQHRYKKEPWFEAMPEHLIRALEKEYGWHLLITCKKPIQ
jgi:SAM-dependent methyltransferase